MAEEKPTPYEQGYALEPADLRWRIEKIEKWAHGVWQRQGELTAKREKFLDGEKLAGLLKKR